MIGPATRSTAILRSEKWCIVMQPFSLIALLLVLSAGFSYLNYRLLKLPTTIGLMASTLIFSVAVIVTGRIFPGIEDRAAAIVRQFDLAKAAFAWHARISTFCRGAASRTE